MPGHLGGWTWMAAREVRGEVRAEGRLPGTAVAEES